jgi:D-ribulokinase
MHDKQISVVALFLVYSLGFSIVGEAFSIGSNQNSNWYIGFDLGTSGARISVVKGPSRNEIFSDSIRWDAYDDASSWENTVYTLLRNAQSQLCTKNNGFRNCVKSICISGTSASCLLVDSKGNPTRTPRMYDYNVVNAIPISKDSESVSGVRALALLDRYAPPQHTTRAPTSSLAKLLTWALEQPLEIGEVLCHQSDYIAMKLMMGIQSDSAFCPLISSDWHNCLKCGYDVRSLEWPQWIDSCLQDAGIQHGISSGVLPSRVVSPGEPLGYISPEMAAEFDRLLSPQTTVVGGTTDSNAAFFAAIDGGIDAPLGTAVTSLGSTLAIKQLSQTYVEDSSRGVYSHRFPSFRNQNTELWLIGGASNVGCAVLRQQGFSDDELVTLSQGIDPDSDTHLSYYPLVKSGERFPIADSNKQPNLEPIPDSRQDFLHGILQSISIIERDGFQVLGELGAIPKKPTRIMTCGGGSKNTMWTQMRQRILRSSFRDSSICVETASNTEASNGAALLASCTFER